MIFSAFCKHLRVYVVVWVGGLFALVSANAAVQVIGRNPAQIGALSQAELRAIYSMKRQYWANGEAITVVTLASSNPLHKQFCQQQLGLLPFQLNREWDRLVFSGTGEPPTEATSVAEMLHIVQQTKGAIGYLPAHIDAAELHLIVRF